MVPESGGAAMDEGDVEEVGSGQASGGPRVPDRTKEMEGTPSPQPEANDDDDDDATVSATVPSFRQLRVLRLYFETGNAAAVARATGMSERHVRRLVHRHAGLLERWRREQDVERLARSAIRAAAVEEWADAILPGTLERLGELVASPEEKTAIQAAKMTFELALRASAPHVSGMVSDAFFRRVGREIVYRLETETELDSS
jgi:hypothetical protein